jgi:2-isopropylmalate synthase
VAYVLEQVFGYRVPKELAIELSQRIQTATDATGKELAPDQVLDIFQRGYLATSGRFTLVEYQAQHIDKGLCHVQAGLLDGQAAVAIRGAGTGAIDAFVAGMAAHLRSPLKLTDYSEHAMGAGADAEAAAYVRLQLAGEACAYGVGRDRDIVRASFVAVLRALNTLG